MSPDLDNDQGQTPERNHADEVENKDQGQNPAEAEAKSKPEAETPAGDSSAPGSEDASRTTAGASGSAVTPADQDNKAEPTEPEAAKADSSAKDSGTAAPKAGAASSEEKVKNPPPPVQHAGKAGKPPPKPRKEDEGMPLLEHLNELRWVVTRIGIIIIVGFFACYAFSKQIYDFISAPLLVAMPPGAQMIYTSPQGLFFTYMKVALMASVILTSPLSFYQIWSFIAPGLYKEERKSIVPIAIISGLVFIIGASFCYIVVLPIAFNFFMGFSTDMIQPYIEVGQYLGFTLKLLIAFGVIFEMPIFAYFLGGMGIITPDMMRSKRQYAILGIFIVAALLTPPDVFSQILMAIPMLILYEVSIYVAGWSRKRKLASDEAYKRMKEGKAPETAEAGPNE